MLLSGRGAPGCAPPGGKSTAGSGGRRTGCAASPPSGQRLAAAASRATTSSGPTAESASLSLSSSSLFPSMALNTSLSSPRTSAAVGGDDAAWVSTGVLALEIVGLRGVEAGEGLVDAPVAAAGAGGPAAGSPGPRWPPAALPPPGACCGTANILDTHEQQSFLSCTLPPLPGAPRPVRCGPYTMACSAPQRRGTSAERLVEVATEAQRHRWPGAAPLAP